MMVAFLPKEVQEGLDRARKAALRRSSRLSVHVGEDVHPVLRAWEGGFAMEAEDAPLLRGLVDLYDGPHHLARCLSVASVGQPGEVQYEMKRMTDAGVTQPVDFERAEDAPVALLGFDRRAEF